MCPNDTPSCTQPLLPKRSDSLFGSEAGSDVVFLVGPGPELYRFPAHRAVLAAASPVFRAMLEGTLPQEQVISVPDLDDRAFHNLLRYLYREEVQLQSVATALATLQAADKYMCDGLVRTCVQYLDLMLEPATVLDVLQLASVYCQDAQPSAPPPEDDDDHRAASPLQPPATADACAALLHNCFQFVDLHADQVLAQEAVEDLDAALLAAIACRPTLVLSSEAALFVALERWSARECRRQHLELSGARLRAVLGEDALFAVRYGLMTSEQFLAGPMQSGLLLEVEQAALLALILGQPPPAATPARLRSLLPLLATPRTCPQPSFARLSRRSEQSPPQPPPAQAAKGPRLLGRKADKGHQDRHAAKRGKGSCVAEYVFRALSCIFD